MSLCAYSDSSSESDGDREETLTKPLVHVHLPSVDDLFNTNTPNPGLQTRSYSVTHTSLNNKRRVMDTSEMSDPKRTRLGDRPTKATLKQTKSHFAPPQLKRPNISTEDLGAWNTHKTMSSKKL